MEVLEGAADACDSIACTCAGRRHEPEVEGSECAAQPLMNPHPHFTHARAVYRGVAPTPRSGCSCVVVENNCIIFGGTLTVQKDVEQPDAAGVRSASRLSRVYFNDLVYLRFDTDTAADAMCVWIHQPKRSGELWPCARSGHAAAAGGAAPSVFPSLLVYDVVYSWRPNVYLWRMV